jgi:hypothetical protein
MSSILVSARLIDLILAFTVLEAVVLGLWRRYQSDVIPAPRALTRDRAFTAPALRREVQEVRSAGQRPAPSILDRYRGIGLMLLPGIFLLMALRAALAGASWPWVPMALTAALIAHLLDLRQRWLG